MNDKQVIDPAFGELVRREGPGWTGTTSLDAIGQAALRIDRGDGSPPTAKQRAVFDRYREKSETLHAAALIGIRHYLSSELRPLAETILDPEDVEDILPAAAGEAWIANQISIPCVVIPDEPGAGEHTPDLALFWECSWDPEHGIAVWFRDLAVSHVTQQVELW